MGADQAPALISGLCTFGFEGPFSGGKHEAVVKGDLVLTIPNPHKATSARS